MKNIVKLLSLALILGTGVVAAENNCMWKPISYKGGIAYAICNLDNRYLSHGFSKCGNQGEAIGLPRDRCYLKGSPSEQFPVQKIVQ